MEDLQISSISQYIDVIEELAKTYQATNPVVTTFVFRGLGDQSYPLYPSVFRQDTEQAADANIANDKYTSWAGEDALLESFIAEAVRYISDIPPQNLCRWAEYAQHYGVPTRFLDWTSNPLAALYFACRGCDGKNAAVWVLHSVNYRHFAAAKNKKMSDNQKNTGLTVEETINRLLAGKPEIDYPILYTPYYVDARMSTQSSYLMVWGNKKQPLEKLIPREKFMVYRGKGEEHECDRSQNQEGKILFKLIFSCDRKQSLIRQLDMLGVNEKSLFPGLDGIGRYIEMKYRFDYDELMDHI